MTDNTRQGGSAAQAISWYLLLVTAGVVSGIVFFASERLAGAIVGAVIALVMALSFTR
jgi:uncharacterized membrane protein YgaE (UPF0421/DUF939 family)